MFFKLCELIHVVSVAYVLFEKMGIVSVWAFLPHWEPENIEFNTESEDIERGACTEKQFRGSRNRYLLRSLTVLPVIHPWSLQLFFGLILSPTLIKQLSHKTNAKNLDVPWEIIKEFCSLKDVTFTMFCLLKNCYSFGIAVRLVTRIHWFRDLVLLGDISCIVVV